MSNNNKLAFFKNALTEMGSYKSISKYIDKDDFLNVAMTCVTENPYLLKGDKVEVNSLLLSFAKACQVGLLPNNVDATIIPFAGQAKFIPMYQGLLKLMRRKANIKNLATHIVYSTDVFEYKVTLNGEEFEHKPEPFKPHKHEDMIGVYCRAILEDGSVYFAFVRKDEIDRIKQDSVQKIMKRKGDLKRSPWNDEIFWTEMIKKTAIRRLYKVFPRVDSDLADRVVKEDEEHELKMAEPVEADVEAKELEDVKEPSPELENKVAKKEKPQKNISRAKALILKKEKEKREEKYHSDITEVTEGGLANDIEEWSKH